MKLVLPTLVVAVGVGRLAGGSLTSLGTLRVRLPALALLGLLLQLILPPGNWPLVLLMISFLLLVVFVSANIRVAGVSLIAVGIALNFLVIAVNHGMPVTRQAIIASGQQDALPGLISDPGAKHHLAGSGDRLMFLGDVLPIAPPVRQIVSVGDIVTYAGVGWLVVAAMRRRDPPGAPAGADGTREVARVGA